MKRSLPNSPLLTLFLVLLAASFGAGAVTVVHASHQKGASSVTSASAPAASEEVPPGHYPDVLTENAPYTARDRSDMRGEWYGLDSNQSVLITLRIESDGEPARLAIARRSEHSIETRIYDCEDVLVKDGHFSLGSQGHTLQLTGDMQASWGGRAGAGRAVLTIEGGNGRQRSEIFFFKAPETSWLDDTLTLARRYGLL